MEIIPSWLYLGLALMVTLALAFHASEWRKYRGTGHRLSHAVLLIGWASITARMWHGISADASVTFAGAAGLILLACGVILRSIGR